MLTCRNTSYVFPMLCSTLMFYTTLCDNQMNWHRWADGWYPVSVVRFMGWDHFLITIFLSVSFHIVCVCHGFSCHCNIVTVQLLVGAVMFISPV